MSTGPNASWRMASNAIDPRPRPPQATYPGPEMEASMSSRTKSALLSIAGWDHSQGWRGTLS
jgi:hypothetical protein